MWQVIYIAMDRNIPESHQYPIVLEFVKQEHVMYNDRSSEKMALLVYTTTNDTRIIFSNFLQTL